MHNIKVKYSIPKYNLGTVFLNYLLSDLIKNRKVKTFDFMLGINPYKLKWTKKTKKIYWKVSTKKSYFNILIHYFKVLFYFLKIKIQKNKYLSQKIKLIFSFFENKRVFKNIFLFIEKNVFKM